MPPLAWSVGSFFPHMFGYVALSTVLEYVWYYRRWVSRRKWRTQPLNETRSFQAGTGGYD